MNQVKRAVVKVGTSTLTHETGKINLERMEAMVRVLSDLMNAGIEIVLVSSGAIGAGAGKLGVVPNKKNIREKQALAAIGQASLVSIYEKFFMEYGYNTGQVLLTKIVLDDETGYQNAKNALETMLSYHVIPIINENDVISTYEIQIGDNDTLSAYVAGLVDADLLVILSDIDGFYDRSNGKYPGELVPEIFEIDEKIRSCAGGEGSKRGTGGMHTKLDAAEIASSYGTDTFIVNGKDAENIYKAIRGERVGTRFHLQKQKNVKICKEL